MTSRKSQIVSTADIQTPEHVATNKFRPEHTVKRFSRPHMCILSICRSHASLSRPRCLSDVCELLPCRQEPARVVHTALLLLRPVDLHKVRTTAWRNPAHVYEKSLIKKLNLLVDVLNLKKMDYVSPIHEILSDDNPPSAPRNRLNVGSRKHT
jgi:hypothetical protein